MEGLRINKKNIEDNEVFQLSENILNSFSEKKIEGRILDFKFLRFKNPQNHYLFNCEENIYFFFASKSSIPWKHIGEISNEQSYIKNIFFSTYRVPGSSVEKKNLIINMKIIFKKSFRFFFNSEKGILNFPSFESGKWKIFPFQLKEKNGKYLIKEGETLEEKKEKIGKKIFEKFEKKNYTFSSYKDGYLFMKKNGKKYFLYNEKTYEYKKIISLEEGNEIFQDKNGKYFPLPKKGETETFSSCGVYFSDKKIEKIEKFLKNMLDEKLKIKKEVFPSKTEIDEIFYGGFNQYHYREKKNKCFNFKEIKGFGKLITIFTKHNILGNNIKIYFVKDGKFHEFKFSLIGRNLLKLEFQLNTIDLEKNGFKIQYIKKSKKYPLGFFLKINSINILKDLNDFSLFFNKN